MKRPSEPKIRFAVPGDEEDICRLIHALAEYEKAPEKCFARPAALRELLLDPHSPAECLIASVAGRTVGFALFFTTYSTWLCRPGMFVEDLFVDPAHRRRGIGRALLRRLAELSRERNHGRMEWACLEWNEPAKAFYHQAGAQPLEEWRTWRLEGEALAALSGDHPGEEEEPAGQDAPANESSPGDKPAEEVVIYTDGGCRPNPGVGGWAAVLLSKGRKKELVGGEDESTNNRMEMTAAISALEALKRPCRVTIHTDSEYLKNGITKWIHGWKRKGWVRNKQGDPVKNVDLWKRLDAAMARHAVSWAWVRGHAGDKYNERCDELCTAEVDRRLAALGRR